MSIHRHTSTLPTSSRYLHEQIILGLTAWSSDLHTPGGRLHPADDAVRAALAVHAASDTSPCQGGCRTEDPHAPVCPTVAAIARAMGVLDKQG